MNPHKTEIAILGAGSAGLAAFREASRQSKDVLLIDPGPLGTTCARTGCMPSKALIHAANTFYGRRAFKDQGILGAGMLCCDPAVVLEHVRVLRDRFAGGMVETTRELAGDRLISERAELLDAHRIQAGPHTIHAEQIILAVGADPVVPEEWKPFGDRVLTSQTVFEQRVLPSRIAVIGLGPVGLELGQALCRLGIQVTGFSTSERIGGLRDPQVNRTAVECIENEFPLHLGSRAQLSELDDGTLRVCSGDQEFDVDAVLAAIGVSPNLKDLGLEKLGIDPQNPPCDPHTGQLGDLPVYIAGDANGYRPILHEALDEGTLAAARASGSGSVLCGCRRVPLSIVFSDPDIAAIGTPYNELPDGAVTGAVDFKDQARAVIEYRNAGRMHLYADPEDGRLLGAEMCAPGADSFGHLLALAIQRHCTVFDLLQMPFYHPTLMEALRTALRDAAEKCNIPENGGEHILDWCCTEHPLT